MPSILWKTPIKALLVFKGLRNIALSRFSVDKIGLSFSFFRPKHFFAPIVYLCAHKICLYARLRPTQKYRPPH